MRSTIQWDKYPSFQEHEFACRCGCGLAYMEEAFLDRLQALRTRCGFPFVITSGYRCAQHDLEVGRTSAGEHRLGKAADIHVYGERARWLKHLATPEDFPRMGENQKGAIPGRFIHLGIATEEDGFHSPTTWTY